MPTFTPSFNAFKSLAALESLDLSAQLQHLLRTAPQQADAQFSHGIQALLGKMATKLETNGQMNQPDILRTVENLVSTFALYSEDAEPGLAASLKDALQKDNTQKKAALLEILNNAAFATAFAQQLKNTLSPLRLNAEEHKQAVVGEALESLSSDNEHTAAQAAYGENAWVRQLFRLFETLLKMASTPSLRSEVESKAAKGPVERRIPMPS